MTIDGILTLGDIKKALLSIDDVTSREIDKWEENLFPKTFVEKLHKFFIWDPYTETNRAINHNGKIKLYTSFDEKGIVEIPILIQGYSEILSEVHAFDKIVYRHLCEMYAEARDVNFEKGCFNKLIERGQGYEDLEAGVKDILNARNNFDNAINAHAKKNAEEIFNGYEKLRE